MKPLAKLLLVFFTACTAEYEETTCGWGQEAVCKTIVGKSQCPDDVVAAAAVNGIMYCPAQCIQCVPSSTFRQTRTCENGRYDDFFNRCICYAGYDGEFCESPVCKHPCQNGGHCSVPKGNQCNCIMGYSGAFCQFYECKPPCKNGGSCIAPNHCTCIEGYRGVFCETPECKPPCKNGGYCSTPSGNQCICPKKYYGASCETEYKLKPGMSCRTNEDCIEGLTCKGKPEHVRQNISMHSCQCPVGCVYKESFESCECGNYYDSAEYYDKSAMWPSIVGSFLGLLIIIFWCCCINTTIQSHIKRENEEEEEYYREQSVNPLLFEDNEVVSVMVVEPFGAAQDIVLPQPQMSVPPYLVGEPPPSYSETIVHVAIEHQGPQPYSAQPFGPQSAPMYTTGSYGVPPPAYSETLIDVTVAQQGPPPYNLQPFDPNNQQPSAPMYASGMYGEPPPPY